MLDPKDQLTILLEAAIFEGTIICLECGAPLEPDAKECSCGWLNPLPALGII